MTGIYSLHLPCYLVSALTDGRTRRGDAKPKPTTQVYKHSRTNQGWINNCWQLRQDGWIPPPNQSPMAQSLPFVLCRDVWEIALWMVQRTFIHIPQMLLICKPQAAGVWLQKVRMIVFDLDAEVKLIPHYALDYNSLWTSHEGRQSYLLVILEAEVCGTVKFYYVCLLILYVVQYAQILYFTVIM